MKNVSEIINQGNKNAELPAWLNMRHAWSASDAKRDEGLIYPNNVIQIKNLDYKKAIDVKKWNESFQREDNERIIYYNEPDDASNLDSERYASNSLFDIYYPVELDAQTSYPVIVSIHGGGWFYGDKELYSYYCCHLASKGFAVVNFNYRLAPQNKYPLYSRECRDASSGYGKVLYAGGFSRSAAYSKLLYYCRECSVSEQAGFLYI